MHYALTIVLNLYLLFLRSSGHAITIEEVTTKISTRNLDIK